MTKSGSNRALAVTCSILVAAMAQPAAAAPIGFAIDRGSNLHSVDFGLGTSALIGNMGVFLEAIALSPGGALYGTSTLGDLFSTGNAATTLIGASGLGNIEGLDFDGGTLIASDFVLQTNLYSLNLGNA